MILIDSDIIIWILRNNQTYKDNFTKALIEVKGNIFITPIQYAEIMTGLKAKEKINTELFLDSLNCLTIDKKIGKLAGYYLNLYHKSHALKVADAIMAATAKNHSLQLWSDNKKHFPMFNIDEFFVA